MRADIDGRVGPEARIAGSGSRSNTSSDAPFSTPESSAARMSASTCKPPRPALMRTGAPSRPPCLSLAISEASMSPRVESVSGRRTTSMSVCASRRFRPSAPEKHSTPGSDFSLALQPATAKPSASASLPRPCPRRRGRARRLDLGGFRLVVVIRPDALALLALVAAQLAQMRERVHDDPFAHAVGEIGIDHAHDRLLGQRGVGEEMIDAGAEREDRLKVRKALRARPADGASSARSGPRVRSNGSSSVATAWDGMQRYEPPPPRRRIPAGHGDEKAHADPAMRSITGSASESGVSARR